MKKLIALPILLVVALTATGAAVEDEHQVEAPLVPVNGSGVLGQVHLRQLKPSGAEIKVDAHGLTPGAQYTSFYYGLNDCTGNHDEIGTFTANAGGGGKIEGIADDDPDEIGSVSVRLGQGYGTLLACARVHEERHIKAPLIPGSGSGVTGKVHLKQRKSGGTEIKVDAHGLTPGVQYTSFYYGSNDCTGNHDEIGTFTADPAGNGKIAGSADDDLDEIGSVSVRLGPGYGALLACARVH